MKFGARPPVVILPLPSIEQMQIRTVLARYHVQKPIWNTEINYGLTGTEVDPAPTNEQQSNVVRTYLLNAANGVERVYWYGWDQQSIVDTLLTEPDLVTLTPAGRAFRSSTAGCSARPSPGASRTRKTPGRAPWTARTERGRSTGTPGRR